MTRHEDPSYLGALLDAVDRPIIVATADGLIQELNTAAEQLLGYAAADVIGCLRVTSLHDGREIAARARALSVTLGVRVEPGVELLLALARKEDEAEPWTYLRSDGERVSVSVAMRSIRDASSAEMLVLLPRAARADASLAAGDAPDRVRRPSPSPARGSTSGCFAATEALRRLSGDAALLDEIVVLFLTEHGLLHDTIALAVSDRDTVAVARGAHKLRGALLNLGAGPAARAALSVEEAGLRGALPSSSELEALSRELQGLRDALHAFQAARAAS
jgi:HPt (histidine-containing phosphotransfer) domain-containing protein